MDWKELEQNSGWAMSKSDEAAHQWDKAADGWQKRIDFEKSFTQAQVDACTRVNRNTTVLDACCGTGRVTLPLAEKAKHVYAIDAGEHMLEHCRRNVEALGLDNVTVQHIDNWHTCTPGVEIPIADIAIAVISPAQADILKFSKCAAQYCYFLSFTKDAYRFVMADLFRGVNEEWEKRPKPPAGPNGKPVNPVNLNIQFNILYDCGVFPEVTYADGAWEHTAATREEVYDYLRSLGHVDADKEERFRANCDKRMAQTEAGLWRYAYESQMYVLGWDPNQIDWDKAAHL